MHILLIALALMGLAMLGSLAAVWAWTAYVSYLKRLPLTRISVPTPPGV